MFEAFVLICTLGLPEVYGNCEEVNDTRGPYATEQQCKVRIVEILQELPKYRPYSYPKGYRCDQSTTTNKQFT
jgi:hypothetical protein